MSRNTVDDRDSSILYSGDWKLVDETQGTFHSTVEPGAFATIKFTGSQIIVTGALKANGREEIQVDFQLDDEPLTIRVVTIQDAEPKYGYWWYYSPPLELGEHTLVAIYRNSWLGTEMTPFLLDSFQVTGAPGTAEPGGNGEQTGGGPPPQESSEDSPVIVTEVVTSTSREITSPESTTADNDEEPQQTLSASLLPSDSDLSPNSTGGPSSFGGSSDLENRESLSGSNTPSATGGLGELEGKSNSGVSKAAIVGGVLGSALFLVLLALLLLFLFRRRRRGQAENLRLAGDVVRPPSLNYPAPPHNPSDVTPFNMLVDVARISEKTGVATIEPVVATFPVVTYQNPREGKETGQDNRHRDPLVADFLYPRDGGASGSQEQANAGEDTGPTLVPLNQGKELMGHVSNAAVAEPLYYHPREGKQRAREDDLDPFADGSGQPAIHVKSTAP